MISTILKVASQVLPVLWRFYVAYKKSEQERKAKAIRNDPLRSWDERFGNDEQK